MTARIWAAAVGVLIVAVASLAYMRSSQPEVAATNTVATFAPSLAVAPGARRCQPFHRLPAGANRLRMSLATAPPRGEIRAEITRRGTIISAANTRAQLGVVVFKLRPRTMAVRRARVCISNLAPRKVVFLGEGKKTGIPAGHPGRTRHRIASLVFLRPSSSSWIGRAGTIIRRFGYVQAGLMGGWTIWLAALLGLSMAAVAFWCAIDPRLTPLRGIPTAGWLSALVALLSALTWSLIVPLFQVPDEQAHVAYAQYLAETGKPPAGRAHESALSQEERRVLTALHWRQVTHRPENPPLDTPLAHRRLEHAVYQRSDRTSRGGASNASQNPPLYYAAAAAAYRLSPSTHLSDRVHAMRFVSVLLAALTVLLIYLFLRELLPGTPWAWTVGAVTVALQPMFGFIGGGVNNDNLLFAASAGILLALAISFRRGLTVRRGVAIGAITAAGLLAKATMFGLVPGVALGLAVLIHRASPEARREAWKGAAAAAGIAVVAGLVFVGLNATVWDRGLLFGAPSDQGGGKATLSRVAVSRAKTASGQLSYVWQFYLPRLSFMKSWFPIYEARNIWINGFVGRFGWLDYGFVQWVYDLALVAAIAVIALAGRALVASRDAVRSRLGELLTYAVLVLGLLALLARLGYGWRLGHHSLFEQARYLFPLLPLYGGLIALAARGTGWRYGPVAGVLIVSVALAQDVVALLMTMTRYYG